MANNKQSEIEGYIVQISPIKCSKNNVPYFNGKLQTSDDTFQDLVGFDEAQRNTLQLHFDSKTPVLCKDVDFVPGRRDSSKKDLKLTRRSAITAAKQLDFGMEEIQQEPRTLLSDIPNMSGGNVNVYKRCFVNKVVSAILA